MLELEPTHTHAGIMLADAMRADEVLEVVDPPMKVGWRVREDGQEREMSCGVEDVRRFIDVQTFFLDPVEVVEMLLDPDGRLEMGVWLDEYPNPRTMDLETYKKLSLIDNLSLMWRTGHDDE